MVDSGIAWIGDVPEGWGVERIAGLYTLRNEKCSDKVFQPLSVTMRGVVPQLEDVAKTDDGDNRKLVRKGDFVINSRSDRRGSCGISKLDGSVSLINTVLCPRDEMTPGYFDWLFHSFAFADEFYANGHGIVDDLWTTRWQDMKKINVPFPPLPEQKAIAAYLDDACGKIDGLREKVERQIAALEEYKKSVITEAVTGKVWISEKGKVKSEKRQMKPSGVEWIGEVPEGWGVKRFCFVFSFSKGLGITKADLVDEGVPVISYGQIHSKDNSSVILKQELLRYVPEDTACNDESAKLRFGDIVFADTSEDYDGAGNCVRIHDDKEIYAGYHTLVARPKDPENSHFLIYLFQAPSWRSQVRRNVNGIKVFSVTQKVFKRVSIVLPPLSEQEAIAGYLDKKCAAIDATVAKCRKQLDNLAEYKKSLIYECVTGKREVA